jgi:hypothetical protein
MIRARSAGEGAESALGEAAASGPPSPGARFDIGHGIAGQVLDPSGAPVADADVIVVCSEGPGCELRSDEAGRFSVQGLSAEVVTVAAQVEGRPAVLREVQPGERFVELRLSEGGRVRFRLAGLPAPPGEVAVFVIEGGALLAGAGALAGDDGCFESTELPARTGSLFVVGAGLVPLEVPGVTTLGGRAVDVGTLKARQGERLRGRVLGESGESVAGLGVSARSLEPERPTHVLMAPLGAVTCEDGTFELGGLPPGRFRVEVLRDEPAGLAFAELEVVEGVTAEATLRFRAPGAADGRVVQGGRPVIGALVITGEPSVARAASTDEEGRFDLDGLPPGRYELSALLPTPAATVYSTTRCEVAPGCVTPVELELPSGPGWSGLLSLAGEPLAQARLRVERVDGPLLVGALALSAADGRFELPHLPPGRYEVVVERPGREPQRLEVELPGSGRADLAL